MSVHLVFLSLSIGLDILANVALSLSRGFKKKHWGVLAVMSIMAAFAFLALAVQGMSLLIAYTVWGVLSIAGTALVMWLFLGQPMNRTIVIGLTVLILAVVLMQV